MSRSQMSSRDGMGRRQFLRVGAATVCSATSAVAVAAEQASSGSSTEGYIDAHVHVWTSDTESDRLWILRKTAERVFFS